MGFFEFLKDIGDNILGKGNDAEDIKKKLITELGASVEKLEVAFTDGIVTLSGVADTPETREKAILLAGNIKGVKTVNGDKFVYAACKIADADEYKEAEMTSDFYTIKSGDTLSAISQKYYGDANKYNQIFEANREVIKHPDKIYPGQQIRIPKKVMA
jgi:nucleoid-associated protein YgaU